MIFVEQCGKMGNVFTRKVAYILIITVCIAVMSACAVLLLKNRSSSDDYGNLYLSCNQLTVGKGTNLRFDEDFFHFTKGSKTTPTLTCDKLTVNDNTVVCDTVGSFKLKFTTENSKSTLVLNVKRSSVVDYVTFRKHELTLYSNSTSVCNILSLNKSSSNVFDKNLSVKSDEDICTLDLSKMEFNTHNTGTTRLEVELVSSFGFVVYDYVDINVVTKPPVKIVLETYEENQHIISSVNTRLKVHYSVLLGDDLAYNQLLDVTIYSAGVDVTSSVCFAIDRANNISFEFVDCGEYEFVAHAVEDKSAVVRLFFTIC